MVTFAVVVAFFLVLLNGVLVMFWVSAVCGRCSGDCGVLASGGDGPTLLGGGWLCLRSMAENYGLQAGCDIRHCWAERCLTG